MKITQEFTVARTVPAVWAQFQDVPAIAQCLPGATLTGEKGDGIYLGRIAVKLGPIASTFEGEATITADPANRSALIDGKGVDKKGGSRGQVKVVYALIEAGSGTNVKIDADITLAGPAAQFGRTGLINEMSRRLITDFVGCLESKMAAATEEEAAGFEILHVKSFRLLLASLATWFRNLFRKRA